MLSLVVPLTLDHKCNIRVGVTLVSSQADDDYDTYYELELDETGALGSATKRSQGFMCGGRDDSGPADGAECANKAEAWGMSLEKAFKCYL